MTESTDDDTGGQTAVLARNQISTAETITGRTCIAVGVAGLGLGLLTGERIGVLAAFGVSLTLVVLSGGLFVTWCLLRATGAACAERRIQDAAAHRENDRQHAELVGLLTEIRSTQGREAEIIGDALLRRRNERG